MGALSFVSSLFSGGVGDVVEKVGDAIHKNVTTDKERIALDNEAKKAEQEYNLKLAEIDKALAESQNAVNLEEAKSTNWFVSGWRPFIGWLCGVTLGIMFVPKALAMTAFWAYSAYLGQHGQAAPPPLPVFPDLGTEAVVGLVMGMLGLGGMRTWEKVKGVAGNH